MNNEKMTIDVKGDKLLLGAHFHILEDKTRRTFDTHTIPEFVKFLSDKPDAELFLSVKGLEAMPAEIDRYAQPLAQCALEESQALKNLRGINGAAKTLQEMTDFLEIHKRYATPGVLSFLDSLRHFKMKKVVGVEMSKERNGNYSYGVTLENAGRDDFEPPVTAVFEVPVYKGMLDQVDTIRLSFEVNFRVTQANPPVLHFILTNWSFEEEVEGKQREIVERGLKDLPQRKLWGGLHTYQQDDAWRYFSNPLPEGEAAKRQIEANNAYRSGR